MTNGYPSALTTPDEPALVTKAQQLLATGKSQRQVAELAGKPRLWGRGLPKSGIMPAVIETGPRCAADYTAQIIATLQKTVESMIEVGRLLNQAKESLPHGEFLKMVDTDLPFGRSTAARFMKIAADARIIAHVQHLPPAWGTLYELTKLDDAAFETRLAAGTIHPDMGRNDLALAFKQERRAAHASRTLAGGTVESLHQLIASDFKAGVIYADPPWKYVTRSERGEGRSANEHYRTEGVEQIKQLPVEQLAADDAVLFVWVVDWCPAQALEVVEAWGFRHRTTGLTWTKLNANGEGWHMGQGYWTRANPEDCWLCTRGNPRRLHEDVRQLLVAPVTEHSRKPDEAYDRIERLVEGPYLELYARRERPGWVSWGDELPFRMPLPSHDPETGEIIEATALSVEVAA